MKKGYYKTKDGRTVKKGLYYYMNKTQEILIFCSSYTHFLYLLCLRA